MSDYDDRAGNPIRVGDYIVYAALWDRSATLKFGRVTELTTRKEEDWKTHTKEPTVKAVSVDLWFDKGHKLQNDGHPVTLAFFDRILSIEGYMVPGDAKKLLDGAWADLGGW